MSINDVDYEYSYAQSNFADTYSEQKKRPCNLRITFET